MSARAHSPPEPGAEPRIPEPQLASAASKYLKFLAKCPLPIPVMVSREGDNQLPLSVTPLAQVAEVCVVELEVFALLMTQASVNMMPHDRDSFQFAVFKTQAHAGKVWEIWN